VTAGHTGDVTRARDEDQVLRLADAYSLIVRPEHLPEVVAAWRMMQPHLARLRAAELTFQDEPASLFRP